MNFFLDVVFQALTTAFVDFFTGIFGLFFGA